MAFNDQHPGPELEALLIQWCEEGAEVARRHHRRCGELKFKYASEAVTEADREIETLLRGRIAQSFPDDLIVGEEFGGPEGGNLKPGKRVWQIDPIDGTLNYALGMPNYCTSLGLMSGDEVLAACIHQPSTGDTFTALAGQGARLNGEALGPGLDKDLKDSVVSLQVKKEGVIMADPGLFYDLVRAPLKLRRCGAVALELAWVAAGFYGALVASFQDTIHLWDIAAGLLLAREAGKVILDFQGQPYKLGAAEMIVGSPRACSQLVTLLA